jgi:hypothetical protein
MKPRTPHQIAEPRPRCEITRAALRKAEFEAMRKAYEREPDSEAEADDWSNAEEFAGAQRGA